MLSRKLKTKKIKKFTTKLIFCWCCPKYTQQRFQNHLISKKVQMYFVSDIYSWGVFYILFHAKSKTARYKSSPDESISQTKTISTFPQFLTPPPKKSGPLSEVQVTTGISMRRTNDLTNTESVDSAKNKMKEICSEEARPIYYPR